MADTGGIKPFPGFQDFGMAGFPYRNLLEQLAASMATPSGGTYGRFGAATTTAPTGGGLLGGPGGGFTGNTGGGLLGTGGFVPDPGNADPGFGAAPSSAAFPNLTDADKAYLYKMQQQYRQDMRAQPGAHQLYFDLFGGQADPTQINALINDTGLNSSILPSFNVNTYSGPLRGMYANLVQQGGGTVNPYGTSTGSTYRPSVPGGMVDYRQYFGPGGPGYAGR